MELGFGPKVSRVAAGVCFLLFVGAVQYFFGRWVVFAVLLLPALLALLLSITLPNSSRKNRIIRLVSSSTDVGTFFIERLDDRFDNLVRRLKK